MEKNDNNEMRKNGNSFAYVSEHSLLLPCIIHIVLLFELISYKIRVPKSVRSYPKRETSCLNSLCVLSY